jgi:class 3 adenylate cyclase
VLSEVIARINHDYAKRIDRLNIVGNGRPWREADEPRVEMLCVLQADVRGMFALMEKGLDEPVRKAIEQAVVTFADSARSREITEGDRILITHDDPAALARIARRILDDVYDAPGQPRLRVALHFGEVRLQADGRQSGVVIGGQAIAWAARIEPRVTPGEIWCTEAFCDELKRVPSLCRTILLAPPPTAKCEDKENAELFNVKKEGSDEADMWVRLYRVEF